MSHTNTDDSHGTEDESHAARADFLVFIGDEAGLISMYKLTEGQFNVVTKPNLRFECHRQNTNAWNATDFCVWGSGMGSAIFSIGVLI